MTYVIILFVMILVLFYELKVLKTETSKALDEQILAYNDLSDSVDKLIIMCADIYAQLDKKSNKKVAKKE